MKKLLKSIAILAALAFGAVAQGNAAVIQSYGAGSAVEVVEASANFENEASLSAGPYVEDGMTFSRTNLSADNNGCGFAGCKPFAFSYFDGNYMYGTGDGGFFTIAAQSGLTFKALELVAGSGNGQDLPVNFTWETMLDGVVTSFGNGSAALGTVVSFADVAGFDTIRWTGIAVGVADFVSTRNAPAFDSVRVQYSEISAPVPEPGTIAIFGLGMLGLMAARKKKA